MTQVDLPIRNFRLFPAANPLGEKEQSLSIELDRTALLLIDVYHAADDPTARELVQTAWDAEFWRIINDRMAPMVERVRKSGIPVVYAMNSAPKIGLHHSPYGWCFHESLGFDPEHDFAEPDVDPLEFRWGPLIQLTIPKSVSPQPGDFYVRKHTYSGFFETRLESVLRNLDVRTLICAGFATDCCVLLRSLMRFFAGSSRFWYATARLARSCQMKSPHSRELNGRSHRSRAFSDQARRRQTSWIRFARQPEAGFGYE